MSDFDVNLPPESAGEADPALSADPPAPADDQPTPSEEEAWQARVGPMSEEVAEARFPDEYKAGLAGLEAPLGQRATFTREEKDLTTAWALGVWRRQAGLNPPKDPVVDGKNRADRAAAYARENP